MYMCCTDWSYIATWATSTMKKNCSLSTAASELCTVFISDRDMVIVCIESLNINHWHAEIMDLYMSGFVSCSGAGEVDKAMAALGGKMSWSSVERLAET